MTDQADEIAPDGFWYVCNASQFQIANVIPLVALGIARCAGVAVLVGRSADPPTETDRTLSIEPGNRFAAAVRGVAAEAGHTKLPIIEIPGDPHDETSWEEPLKRFLSRREPSFVVYNYAGGTRATLLGGIFALEPSGNFDSAILTYVPPRPGQPAQVRQIKPVLRALNIDGDWTLPLDTWCHLMGYEIAADRELAALKRHVATNWLGTRLFPAGDRDSAESNLRIRYLNRTFGGRLINENDQGPSAISFKRLADMVAVPGHNQATRDEALVWISEVLMALEEKMPGTVSRAGNEWRLAQGAARYLAGGWFEEAVFLLAFIVFKKTGAIVRVGVDLKPAEGPAAHRDLDVAIMYRSQLHIIECKTGLWSRTPGSDLDRVSPRTIRTLAEYRGTLAGPYGRVALVSAHDPRVEGGGDVRPIERIEAEARKLAVEPPIHGVDWDYQLVTWLEALRDGA